MPTVATRRRTRLLTTHQWASLGYSPILIEQDPHLPVGHASQLVTAQAAIRKGLETGAGTIIYSEDDVDLDPGLVDYLSPDEGTIISLFFRPRFAHGKPYLAPARTPSRWLSSLTLVMRRDVARALVVYEGRPGIDIAARATAPIMLPPRPFVEHRRLPRVASQTTQQFTTQGGYQGPDSHLIATRLWEWLPARTDRRRVTSPAVAAAVLGYSLREMLMVYTALIEMGCVLRDRAGYHRSAPLPWETTTPAPVLPVEEGLF